ncbi:MAG TPA: penicillin-binding transpeptidase domain-containing protein [Solirubrobacteraceae bacterium]|jgi:peptidoglycan glycosyltransferase|nr:penicillin-binding transpeptidase domain-containing protein [Solirubrobacteraceae bacterium]
MNRPILRLYALVVVLFAVLVAFTSRWTVFEASSLRTSALNRRSVLEQQRIDRGEILAADGTVLARSVRGAEGTYRRVYPTGSQFTHAVGYSFIDLGQAGTERYRSAALNGQERGSVQSVLDQLQGRKPQGEAVQTTLRPAAQRTAIAALGEHEGAVVAIQPQTGAVEVMASSPSYDANSLSSSSAFARLTRDSSSPLVNRATQFGYAPGSTFKVVTAVAAIDSGRFTPESTVSGRNEVPISGVPLKNDNDESFGQITLTEGLVHSVNTVYAQVAEQLGKPTMARYMARFGFDRKPRLDYPSEQMSSSGEYLHGRLLAPTSEYVDVGRMGIGQDKLQVTPLQMAEVAAAVANKGVLMTPHLTSAIVEPDGRVAQRVSPKAQSVVMRPSTAASVTKMMEAVVNEGTGTSAQIPGVQVAGKTGTAETQIGAAINNVWFIAFAPAQNPTVAVAVTLKGVPGQGAAFAAPVAKQVIESLLHG